MYASKRRATLRDERNEYGPLDIIEWYKLKYPLKISW
jgi:hypothetical protein